MDASAISAPQLGPIRYGAPIPRPMRAIVRAARRILPQFIGGRLAIPGRARQLPGTLIRGHKPKRALLRKIQTIDDSCRCWLTCRAADDVEGVVENGGGDAEPRRPELR